LPSKSSKILDLINFVSVGRRRAKEMVYLHIKVNDDSDNRIEMGEIQQILEFKFGKNDISVYRFDDCAELVMLMHNRDRLSLTLFEKAVYENFSRKSVHVSASELDEGGMHTLADLLERLIPEKDEIARLSLKRMRRLSNCILVLDDDLMVLKTMENILKSFGSVEIAQGAEKFLSLYKEYMPNIIFVDIHLRNERGPDVIRKIRSEIDPDVHAIMISGDSAKQTVLDVKEAGAKGFIVKPFNRDIVYKYLLKAPTFVPRSY
jgi:two-component system chemotaxis response regulator CheY